MLFSSKSEWPRVRTEPLEPLILPQCHQVPPSLPNRNHHHRHYRQPPVTTATATIHAPGTVLSSSATMTTATRIR